MDDNHFGYKQTKIPKKDTTTKWHTQLLHKE
jgi:hypothetical protein